VALDQFEGGDFYTATSGDFVMAMDTQYAPSGAALAAAPRHSKRELVSAGTVRQPRRFLRVLLAATPPSMRWGSVRLDARF
jgi:hypothetical protein